MSARLATWAAPPIGRRLLVTGCGRSGTKYISFVCRRLGLDIPHEKLGRDGIASWTMATPAAVRPYGPPTDVVRFRHVFHQVRHPLHVIASVESFEPASWAFIGMHIECGRDEPVVLRGARYWLHWNELAERMAEWRYRVEDIDTVLDEFCSRIGITCDAAVLSRVPRDINTRVNGRAFHRVEELFERMRLEMPSRLRTALERSNERPNHGSLDWNDLDALDAELAQRIRSKAAAYGYDV